MVVTVPDDGGGAAGDLPVDLTRFIGRRRELAAARQSFERARLVTLTGTGGVGKTRLAFQLAREVSRAFEEGVRVVALADLQDRTLLGHTVNAAVGIRETSARWQLDTLVEYLGDRQMLIVLDNCEHLVDDAAELAAALLRSCPRLRILATSRQALNIDGETVVPVPPLSVPDVDNGWNRSAAAADSEAVSLFVDRAASVVPGFTLSASTQPQVVELCRLLDGIPLAIELAAVRLRVLPLAELSARMGDRYRLLTQGSRTAPPRHQTLRACIDWTFELCSPAERLLWSRLSVFTGGFGLDAAEAVGSGGEIERDEVLDLVAGLVDKSILTRVMEAREPRYQMLETIRQYGAGRLAAEERAELEGRHRRWYVALAERADLDWSGPRQVEWLERLRWEHANLRAALNSGLAADPVAGMRLAYSIENYWLARGFLAEARQWLDRLGLAGPDPTVERGRVLRLNAWLAILQGDHEVVSPLLEQAAEIASTTGDPLLAAFVDQTWGLLALFQGDLALAVERLEEAVARFAELGHRTAEIHSMFEVGLALSLAGEGERAAAWHRRCCEITTGIGESWWRSFSLWAFGIEKLRQGDVTTAAKLERETLELKRQLDDQLGTAVCLEAMSWIVASEGDAERAARLLGAADAMLRKVGMALDGIPRLWAFHLRGEDTMRRRASERGFRSAYAAGANLPTDAAVALALDDGANVVAAQPRRENPAPVQDALTRREHEISMLVARGLTNREIASSLVISVRTVEKHVDHIMSKLGLGNRTQIAAWVADARGEG
ncbi:helix-turn-helix transcriptional regulator [Nocardia ignorata]|uniref:Non-specific serine/threonine protein kinase n=1 Tax=Nocardia ignorata TaxID=145285 RepID=A0A4V3CPH0_NOCIG|nr:LuxR C-terminal-related transcriptional regulator [Nocardia ignorata]TDP37802.1 non-specific serine/threonine protein kinase [Nocardia ignorata]